jgi:hypothetical protein
MISPEGEGTKDLPQSARGEGGVRAGQSDEERLRRLECRTLI